MTSAKVVSVLVCVPLAEIEQAGEKMLVNWFRVEELSYLENRKKRTTAGWLALKQAVSELLAHVEDMEVKVMDIELFVEGSGRPSIKKIHDTMDEMQKMSVSISHSRTTAYGLATMEIGANG